MFCERAARIIGLDIAGIDLMTPDISRPLPERAGIIEVNAGPGLRMHHHPSHGQARDAASAIIDMLFPEGDSGRIPTVAIMGTNGKTTVARMVEHVLSTRFRTIGLTTTEGIWIGGKEVARGDTTRPWSARVVLSDPNVEAAVLETARGYRPLRPGL
jgi:cyanophycin synthetase